MDCDGSGTPAWTGRARLAVLIDGENASARHAQAVFEAAAKLGEATVRRIYGDFSNGRLASWNAAIRWFAIVQHQQPAHARGKNAADIALVIDAMDLMYRERLDGFCLMSSDSDFSPLAQRLREGGFPVYGFGERKTPQAFRNACHRFAILEDLLETVPEEPNGVPYRGPERRRAKQSPHDAAAIIAEALGEVSDGGWVDLAGIGSRIGSLAPGFDPGAYGCAKLSTLVEKAGGFEIRKGSGGAVRIRRKVGGTRGRRRMQGPREERSRK